MIILELNEVDARSFALFRQYQNSFETLVNGRVFDIKNGSAELHFDHLGRIAAIKRHELTYKLFT